MSSKVPRSEQLAAKAHELRQKAADLAAVEGHDPAEVAKLTEQADQVGSAHVAALGIEQRAALSATEADNYARSHGPAEQPAEQRENEE